MNRRLRRALEPGFRLFFLVLLLFAGASFFFSIPLAAAELFAVALLYAVYQRISVRRRREILQQIDTISAHVDTATKDSVLNFPLPLVIVKLDSGDIVWGNDKFQELSGQRERLFEVNISHVVPGFSFDWLLDGKQECPAEISLQGRQYTVYGSMSRAAASGRTPLGNFYWMDVTELSHLRLEKTLSAPVVAVLLLDNYDECMKNCSDAEKSSLLAAVDERVNHALSPLGGVLRKFERDRYLLVFQQRHLSVLLDPRDSLLDAAREIKNERGLAMTLSIGVCVEGEQMESQMAGAQLAIEMALSRGGDQIVVKNRFSFDFYGGRSKDLEKHTKVKSRVMASALSRLMSDSSQLMIMGHRGSDLDSVGAAVGVAAVARKLGKPARLVIDKEGSAAGMLIERLQTQPEYQNAFISAQEALLLADRDTLLVIVDVGRPDIVESPELLQSIGRVAVIDHHRRAAQYIEHTTLNYHEPYASSASELVCELLQYVLEPGDLKRMEAEALLAGIVLDTKNFQVHTGARTFEAAAWLRGAGADTAQIKLMFQEDLDLIIARGELLRSAVMVRPYVAVAAASQPVSRVIAAQVADQLLDVRGIQASFVVSVQGAEMIISARSLGTINVQIICERLGGGGHQAMAGAQIQDQSLDVVLQRLAAAINEYCDEMGGGEFAVKAK